MQKALVSIIMPIFNSEQFLGETIESILKQSYKEIELICIDDGSTDNSLKILNGFAASDERITVLSQINEYAGIARNRGKKKAKGEYIIFLDADDFFQENLIEKVVRKAEETDAQITIFDAWIYSIKTKERKSEEWILNTKLTPDKSVFSAKECSENIFNISTTAAWNKLYKREYIEKLGILFQNTNHINDLYFTTCAIAMAERICILDEKLMDYRVDNDRSLQGKKKRVRDFIDAFNALYDFLNQKKIWNVYNNSYSKLCLNNIIEYLHKQRTVKDFIIFYNMAKNELLPYCDMEKNLFNNKYIQNRICRLRDNTALEYLFLEYLYERERDICLCRTIEDLGSDTQYLNNYIKDLNNHIEELESIIYKKIWRVPFEEIPNGSKIILYGAGDVGTDFYNQLIFNNNFEIVGWVDRNYKKISRIYKNVENPEKIGEKKFDYIIIAINNKDIANGIKYDLLKLGVPQRKIKLLRI